MWERPVVVTQMCLSDISATLGDSVKSISPEVKEWNRLLKYESKLLKGFESYLHVLSTRKKDYLDSQCLLII